MNEKQTKQILDGLPEFPGPSPRSSKQWNGSELPQTKIHAQTIKIWDFTPQYAKTFIQNNWFYQDFSILCQYINKESLT